MWELVFTKSSDATTEESSFYCCGETAKLEQEINVMVLNISQCYIHVWYDKISDSEEFVLYLNGCMRETLINLCKGVSKIDRKKFSFVIMQLYLHFLTHIVDAKQKSGKFKLENFQMRHWAIKDSLTEWCYLQSLVSTLIDTFGPAEYHSTFHSKCNPVLHAVVVEILAENVIYPLLNVLSDPVRLNSWILKFLLNYVMKQEQTEVISMDGISHQSSSLNLDSGYGIKPKILLPAEDSFVDSVSENMSVNVSDNTLTIPPDTYVEGPSEECHEVFRKLSDIGDFEDLPNFIGTGLKSSSNINLLNSDFLDTKDVSSEKGLPVSCDTSTIKRSKSADYIRQMPQLKALNVKEYSIVLQSENNKMLVALRPDANPNNLVEQAEEAVEIEVPTLFTDVKITDTQQQSEAGLLPYILYCIQYSGVFHDTSSETPHFVKQVVSIKRRFREFLALQSRLEDNPSLKNYLKGIKGPSKGLALPFSNLDKKNIAERKSFLESYLKELCSQGPIAQSSELQQFLAYGGDARIAFVKKAVDIGVPRIDKMLVRGVKGAIDMFRTAMPNSPIEGGCSDSNLFLNSKALYEDISPDYRFQEHLLEFSSKEPEIKESVVSFLENFSKKFSSRNVFDTLKRSDSNGKRSSLLHSRCSLNIDESCMCIETANVREIFMLEENPFGDTVFQLLMEAVKLNNLNKACILSIGKLLYSSCIDRFIISKIDKISEEQFAVCLHLLHKALWPDEKSQDENKTKPDSASQIKKIIECLETFLAKNYMSLNMSYTLRKFVLSKIHLFLSSVQHQESNRCLLFHIFDVVIETLCSKEE
ncbi:sorting nexin-19-like [Uloborus diversus]|uniref:sorting nexin-19-like n=1 Tax=Uloborus diversus TaxID=327109 RepID=UPI00240A2C84|nr:sorting nexin-19-like [Uloborus diversus]